MKINLMSIRKQSIFFLICDTVNTAVNQSSSMVEWHLKVAISIDQSWSMLVNLPGGGSAKFSFSKMLLRFLDDTPPPHPGSILITWSYNEAWLRDDIISSSKFAIFSYLKIEGGRASEAHSGKMATKNQNYSLYWCQNDTEWLVMQQRWKIKC